MCDRCFLGLAPQAAMERAFSAYCGSLQTRVFPLFDKNPRMVDWASSDLSACRDLEKLLSAEGAIHSSLWRSHREECEQIATHLNALLAFSIGFERDLPPRAVIPIEPQ